MTTESAQVDAGRDRTRRVRRNAILLGLVAFAFYVAFILMAVTGVRG